MAYAQKGYAETQGIEGKYSISSIGCFITAFCNLELDYGTSIDPLALNNYFVQHGSYIDIDDGIRDDVGWSTVSQYDTNTQVTQTLDKGIGNQTAGWPNSNHAIVRFYYRSPNTGQMTTHFCKVADFSTHTIVDSWDGVIKTSPYGEPTAWATYTHTAPVAVVPAAPTAPRYTVIETYPTGKLIKLNKQPTNLWGMNYDFEYMAAHPVETHNAGEVWTVTNKVHHIDGYDYYRREGQVDGFNVADCDDYTAPAPSILPEGARPVPTDTTPYMINDDIPYFGSAQDAQTHTNPKGELKAETSYFRYKSLGGMDSLTDTPGTSQSIWVNPADNVTPVKVITPSTGYVGPRESTAVPVAVVTAADIEATPTTIGKGWKGTLEWFHPDTHKPVEYKAAKKATITDLAGVAPCDLPAYEGDTVKAYGKLEKDDIVYYLLHIAKDFHYTNPITGKQYFVSADPNWQYWYCLPMYDKLTGAPNLVKKSELVVLVEEPLAIVEDIAAKTRIELEQMQQAQHKLTLSNQVTYIAAHIGKIMDVIAPKRLKALVEQIKKEIQ